MIKHLCAFGDCRRALEEGASPTALASALASATPLVDPDSSDTDAPTRAELARTLRRFLLHLRWDDEPSGVDSDGLCQAGVDGTQPSDSTCTAHSGTTPAPASNQPHRHPDGLSSANSWRSHLSPLHIAAYLLDAEALAAMLRRAPSQHLVDVKDDRGRTPLHYAVHAAERHKGLVYLFTPQPFRTWLASHSKSRLRFAPPLTRLNVTRELYGVQYETVTALLHAKASPTVADDSGIRQSTLAQQVVLMPLCFTHLVRQPPGGRRSNSRARRRWLGGGSDAFDTDDEGSWGRTGIDLAAAAGFDSNALLSSSPETPTREDTEQKTSARCGIDELDADAITPAEIHQKYILRGRPFALRNATRGWPAETLLTREAFRSFGAATWTSQLLLPGRPTELSPYLKRAASGELTRPIAFNRPSDPNLLHALRAPCSGPTPSPVQASRLNPTKVVELAEVARADGRVWTSSSAQMAVALLSTITAPFGTPSFTAESCGRWCHRRVQPSGRGVSILLIRSGGRCGRVMAAALFLAARNTPVRERKALAKRRGNAAQHRPLCSASRMLAPCCTCRPNGATQLSTWRRVRRRRLPTG